MFSLHHLSQVLAYTNLAATATLSSNPLILPDSEQNSTHASASPQAVSSTNNLTLNDWPSHLPWTLPIRTTEPSLSLEIVRYQRNLNPSLYFEAQVSFARIIVQIEREGDPEGYISKDEYEYDFVTVAVYYDARGTIPNSRKDLIAVLQNVKGFMRENGAREMFGSIRDDEGVMGHLLIQWKGVEHGVC